MLATCVAASSAAAAVHVSVPSVAAAMVHVSVPSVAAAANVSSIVSLDPKPQEPVRKRRKLHSWHDADGARHRTTSVGTVSSNETICLKAREVLGKKRLRDEKRKGAELAEISNEIASIVTLKKRLRLTDGQNSDGTLA